MCISSVRTHKALPIMPVCVHTWFSYSYTRMHIYAKRKNGNHMVYIEPNLHSTRSLDTLYSCLDKQNQNSCYEIKMRRRSVPVAPQTCIDICGCHRVGSTTRRTQKKRRIYLVTLSLLDYTIFHYITPHHSFRQANTPKHLLSRAAYGACAHCYIRSRLLHVHMFSKRSPSSWAPLPCPLCLCTCCKVSSTCDHVGLRRCMGILLYDNPPSPLSWSTGGSIGRRRSR